MKVTAEVPELASLNQIASLPLPGSIAYEAVTAAVLPALVASPLKRRRKRLGPVTLRSYGPLP